ncbi:zeta toxin family protein [Kitasatospora sp. RG8]|nr:zeta toxin family protein [Kitasatospora sp. RG8]
MSDAERRDVLVRQILPHWTKGTAGQERPVVVLVAGQPGAGKSTLADLVHVVLDARGGAVRIGSDLYKDVHRRYRTLLERDVRTAGAEVRPDERWWQAAVLVRELAACGEFTVAEVLDAAVDAAIGAGLLALNDAGTASDLSMMAEQCLGAVPYLVLAVALASADLD